MDYREDWLISQRQMQKMYKQNMPNMGGYYGGGYGYMSPQMNYMYPGGGYGGIPGVGYGREYYGEKGAEHKKKSPGFGPRPEPEEEKI